jgi:hypothetical protein
MIYLKDDCLEISFPELQSNAGIRINFQRTLRIPDDEKTHSLPPGLGKFPLRHIEDFDLDKHNHLKERGGIIMPMFQAEAMWLNFDTIPSFDDMEYPIAVKIGTGKICAVSGESWNSTLNRHPQDYLVVPEQPWIDGYNVEKGKIKQFVAAPMGKGYTVEEQITGEADVGGLQIQVFPMKKEFYERLNEQRKQKLRERRAAMERESAQFDDSRVMYSMEPPASCMESPPVEMGLAPGGSMRQEIYEDPYDLEVWDLRKSQRCFVTIANADQWMSITGGEPPISPITAGEYTEAGLPWFEYYADDQTAIEGAQLLGNIKSIKNITPTDEKNIWPKEKSTFKAKLAWLTKRKVSAGKWP